MEFVTAVGKKFHKACFRCSSCNVELGASQPCLQGTLDKKIFCEPCYAANNPQEEVEEEAATKKKMTEEKEKSHPPPPQAAAVAAGRNGLKHIQRGSQRPVAPAGTKPPNSPLPPPPPSSSASTSGRGGRGGGRSGGGPSIPPRPPGVAAKEKRPLGKNVSFSSTPPPPSQTPPPDAVIPESDLSPRGKVKTKSKKKKNTTKKKKATVVTDKKAEGEEATAEKMQDEGLPKRVQFGESPPSSSSAAQPKTTKKKKSGGVSFSDVASSPGPSPAVSPALGGKKKTAMKKKKKKKKTTKTEAEPKTAKNKKSPTRKKGVSFGTSPATAIDTKKQMKLEPPPSLQLPVDEEDDDDLHESEEDDAFDSSMAASPHINSSSDNVSCSAIPQRSPSLQKLILSPRERAMSASLAAAHSAGEVIPPRSPSRRKMRKSGRTGTMAVTARQVRRHSALEVVGDIRAQLASDGDCENANGTISAAPKTAFKQRELEQILSHMSVLPVLRDIEADRT